MFTFSWRRFTRLKSRSMSIINKSDEIGTWGEVFLHREQTELKVLLKMQIKKRPVSRTGIWSVLPASGTIACEYHHHPSYQHSRFVRKRRWKRARLSNLDHWSQLCPKQILGNHSWISRMFHVGHTYILFQPRSVFDTGMYSKRGTFNFEPVSKMDSFEPLSFWGFRQIKLCNKQGFEIGNKSANYCAEQ